jgi:serine/threonine protein kinase
MGIDIDAVIIAIVLVYIVIGITVAIVVARRKREGGSGQDYGKVETPNSTGDNIYMVNRRYEVKMPPHKQGGMAAIWLAVERKKGRACIIKTPRRGTALDNVYLDKLMLEASYLKKLRHPSIVKYVDDFYYNGEFHMVIEYLHGETLMASSPRTPFNEQQVIIWASQLLDALSYIHAADIVHRDINPKNIMLCSDGTVKLIDFGTAKKLNHADKDESRHDPFTQIANRGFDIPELFIGGESDQRTDLCGMAQTCIYLLTLKQPNEICMDLFKSNWPRSYSEAKLVADYLISAGISKRMAKCLAQGILFSPGNRFADAHAMQVALSSADGYPIKSAEVVSKK